MRAELSLRVRLVLWYSLVFAAALFSLGTASLWMVHSAITNIENNELQQRVKSVRQFLEARPKGETPEQLRTAFTAAYDTYHGHKWLQVIDERGVWAYRSSHVSKVYPTLVLPQQAPENGSYFVYTTEGLHVRALIEAIQVKGVRYTVQTGLTLDKALAILSDFQAHLSLLMALGLIVSSFAGYFMSRKALTPIAAIASRAQHINDTNLNLRLPALQTHDELAALSETLNQMLGRIEAGYQSVRSFTANAAHELRSPIALLRAEIEVALAFPRDDDYYRNTCRNMLEKTIQLTHILDQMLTLARMDADAEILQFEPVNLPDLAEEVAAEWADRFEQATISFQLDRLEGAPEMSEFWIMGDHLALKRLLNTLLENAWRYTPAGQSVTLGLRRCAMAAGTATAEISVSDTGIGISREDLARIFVRFCRVARPLRGDFSGSGLGLVLAQWIANRHESAIQVESTVGRGSRFFLQFAESSLDRSKLRGQMLLLEEPWPAGA